MGSEHFAEEDTSGDPRLRKLEMLRRYLLDECEDRLLRLRDEEIPIDPPEYPLILRVDAEQCRKLIHESEDQLYILHPRFLRLTVERSDFRFCKTDEPSEIMLAQIAYEIVLVSDSQKIERE